MAYEDEFPPVETIPFDEFFDVAGRYRCPALNIYGFRVDLGNIRCRKIALATINHKATRFRNRVSPLQGYTIGFDGARICRAPGFSSEAFTYAKPKANIACKITAINAMSSLTRRGISCANGRAKDFMTLKVETCRLKSVTNLALFNRKICAKTARSVPDLIGMIRKRRMCGTFPLGEFKTKWMCRKIAHTIDEYSPFVGIKRPAYCKTPEVFDISKQFGKYVCRPIFGSVDLPTHFGMYAGLKRFNCRVTGLMEAPTSARFVCRNLHLTSSPIKMATHRARFACNIYPQVDLQGKRWRCGTILLTPANFKVYGRIWGTTWNLVNTSYEDPYFANFVNSRFIRKSGRMNGKTRY